MGDEHSALLTRLQKIASRVESSQSERDRLIVEAVEAHVPVQQVAKSVGLSRARIYQIIAEQSA